MQKYTIHHPNAKCTGSALTLTPRIADAMNRVEGHIILGIAQQTSTGNEVESKPTFPTFDWEKQIAVQLDPVEVMEIIRVFKGEQENINDGMGIYSQTEHCALNVRHLFDPVHYFSVTITTTKQNGAKIKREIELTLAEAETICIALTYAMGPMVFGL